MTQSTSALSIISSYYYDVRGRVTQLTRTPPTGQGTARTTNYSYDSTGQLLSVTTPDNITLSYSYDAAHDLRSITDNLGNRIEYSYDLKGNRIDENIKDPAGTPVKTVQTSYDLRNRIQTINNAGSITQMIHDAVGNRISETDPNQNPATTHHYDALNRLQQTLDALGNTTQYQYDTLDQLKQVQAANGIITQYQYDDFGQLFKETSSDQGISTYTYDATGNMLSKTDANNVTAHYSYDTLNRITTIDYPGTEPDISYAYDNCINGTGRLCSVTDSHSQVSYQYDPWGNRSEISNTIGNKTYATEHSYDADNKLLSTTYPSGRQINYQRNAIGQISEITSTWAGISETIATQINYLPFGPVKTITFANGLQEQRSYDQAYRLNTQITPGLQDRQYHYDAAGNILAIDQGQGIISLALEDPETSTDTTDTGDITEVDETIANSASQSVQTSSSYNYLYDPLHRITEETGVYGQRSYSYDANGNRLTRNKVDQLYNQQQMPLSTIISNQNYNYPPDNQHLIQISSDKNGANATLDLNYDAAGNTLNKANQSFTYDARNRIDSYRENGNLVATYRYNAQGQRIEKIKHGITKILHFHYDQQGQLISITRYSNSGVLQAYKDIIWLNNIPLAQITTQYNTNGSEKSTERVNLHTDQLNTPRIATDSSQTVVWSWDSDAFGLGEADTDPDKNGRKTSVPLRFPGQLASEGGLYYNYHRYYDPNTGRYITSDPIGLDGGLNTYVYVGGNPLSYTDSLGLLPEDFYAAESIMEGVFQGRNIPTITSCDQCRDVRPFNEGVYDPEKNRITINEYDFGNDGNLWNDVLTDAQAKALLHVHFHEMIHANQNLLSRAIIQYFETYDGSGIGNKLHDKVDDFAKILTNKYLDDFNNRRKELLTCE